MVFETPEKKEKNAVSPKQKKKGVTEKKDEKGRVESRKEPDEEEEEEEEVEEKERKNKRKAKTDKQKEEEQFGEDSEKEDDEGEEEDDDDDELVFTKTKEDIGEEEEDSNEEEEEEESEADEKLNTKNGKKANSEKEELLDATFDFKDPNERHFEALRTLMGRRCLFEKKNSIGVDEICNCICNQGNIGVVVSTSNDDDENLPIAFLTVLNFSQYDECLRGLQKYLLNCAMKYASSSDANKFQKLFDKDSKCKVGVMFNERFVNCPSSIATHMHQILVEDIKWSTLPNNHEIPEDEKAYYFYSHIILYTKIFVDTQGPSGIHPMKKQRLSDLSEDLIKSGKINFSNFDEEEYFRVADISFMWDANKNVRLSSFSSGNEMNENAEQKKKNKKAKNGEVKTFSEYRLVCVVPFNKMRGIANSISKIKTFEKQKQILTFDN